jgi:hypothetical protein
MEPFFYNQNEEIMFCQESDNEEGFRNERIKHGLHND